MEGIVYQATVKECETNITETYIGLTADPFKNRYGNHLKSFRHKKYISDSELSKHIWKLKDENKSYTISWKIIDRGNPLTLTQRFANYALEKNITSSTGRNFAHSTTIMSWEPIVATRENFSTHLNPILICSTGLFSVFLLNPVVLL